MFMFLNCGISAPLIPIRSKNACRDSVEQASVERNKSRDEAGWSAMTREEERGRVLQIFVLEEFVEGVCFLCFLKGVTEEDCISLKSMNKVCAR
jgi:hypothetical protein